MECKHTLDEWTEAGGNMLSHQTTASLCLCFNECERLLRGRPIGELVKAPHVWAGVVALRELARFARENGNQLKGWAEEALRVVEKEAEGAGDEARPWRMSYQSADQDYDSFWHYGWVFESPRKLADELVRRWNAEQRTLGGRKCRWRIEEVLPNDFDHPGLVARHHAAAIRKKRRRERERAR
jgi:hypothetical protein